MLELHVLDLEIKIALVAIKRGQRIPVIVKIILLEHATAGHPGKHPALLGLDLLAQLLLLEGRRTDEINLRDLDLLAFDDLEHHRADAGIFINAQDVFDLRVRVAVFLVELLHLLHVAEQLLFIQRLAHLHRDLLFKFGIADLFVAVHLDVRQARTGLHDVGQHHAAIVRRFRRDADVVKLPRAIERVDIVLGGVRPVAVASLGADVGAEELFADGGRPDILDVNAADFQAGGLRPRGGGAGQQKPESEKANKRFHRLSARHVFITDFGCAFKSRIRFQKG